MNQHNINNYTLITYLVKSELSLWMHVRLQETCVLLLFDEVNDARKLIREKRRQRRGS